MSKYLIFVLFGIILFILFNRNERFSVGAINIDEACNNDDDCNSDGGNCSNICLCTIDGGGGTCFQDPVKFLKLRNRRGGDCAPDLGLLDMTAQIYEFIRALLSVDDCWEFSRLYRNFSITSPSISRTLNDAVNEIDRNRNPTELKRKFDKCKSIFIPGNNQENIVGNPMSITGIDDELNTTILTSQPFNDQILNITSVVRVPNVRYNNVAQTYELDNPTFMKLPFYRAKDLAILSIPNEYAHTMTRFVVEYNCTRDDGLTYILSAGVGQASVGQEYNIESVYSYEITPLSLQYARDNHISDPRRSRPDVLINYLSDTNPLFLLLSTGIIGEIVGINRRYVSRNTSVIDNIHELTGASNAYDTTYTIQLYIDLSLLSIYGTHTSRDDSVSPAVISAYNIYSKMYIHLNLMELLSTYGPFTADFKTYLRDGSSGHY